MSIPNNIPGIPANGDGNNGDAPVDDSTRLSDMTRIPGPGRLPDDTHAADPAHAGGHAAIVADPAATRPTAGPATVGPMAASSAGSAHAPMAREVPSLPSRPVAPPATLSGPAPSSRTSPVSPGPASLGGGSGDAAKAGAPGPHGVMAAPSAEVAHFQRSFEALVSNVSKVVVGKEIPIRLCATALLVGGHVLLEDNPGTGKTQLARGLAHSIRASFKRIQFTPDLLPADVTGITFYDQKTGDFTFREGPVFASIVLADEINRASPKTQSALLEVMEEQKVTVDGVTHPMPRPFIVIATQNPIEQLGTYRLPEAQMDRFLIKTSIGYPGHEAGVSILRQMDVTDRAGAISPVLTGEEVLALRASAERIHVDDAILEYIMRLVERTRASERTVVGASMRGALALTRCARVWAAADGRGYVVPDDVKDLAVAVLSHRVTLTAEATFAGETPVQLIEQTLRDVPAPTLGA